MSQVMETTATLEDATHLTLHQPLRLRGPREVRVAISDEDDASSDDDGRTVEDRREFERFQALSASEKAADLKAWIHSLPPGPGLSDWAVSRDSIYD